MLIDAGESDEEYKVASKLVEVKNIDVVVVTHPHADHIGGMKSVLNTYSIGQFVDSGYPHTTIMYENMLSTIDKKNIPYITVKNGDILNFDPNVKIKILNPQPKFFNELNDNSVVILMTYKNVSLLFTGDSQLNAESMYARNLGHVDVLKVAHHGSSTSTGAYLISKTHPDISIISVGKDNSYGHPDSSVIKRLTNDGSKVYRTDLNGSIVVTTDGNLYSVITERF
jgi:beta-lactamase superfamily II metal-dependent hydrolase